MNKNPYLKFKPKMVETERIVLSIGEVDRIEALAFYKDEFTPKGYRASSNPIA